MLGSEPLHPGFLLLGLLSVGLRLLGVLLVCRHFVLLVDALLLLILGNGTLHPDELLDGILGHVPEARDALQLSESADRAVLGALDDVSSISTCG